MAKKPVSAKTKLRSCLVRMEKKYGVTKTIGGGPTVGQGVFLIFRQGWDFKKASRAARILESEFIDWNEIRVSAKREIQETLAFLKFSDMENRIINIQEYLREVFTAYNDLDNDLFKTMEFESFRRFIIKVTALGKPNAYILLQCHRDEAAKKSKKAAGRGAQTARSGEPDLVVSPESMRVAIRLGIIKKTLSIITARRDLAKLLNRNQYLPFQNSFVRHAEAFCLSKNPRCRECILKGSCKYAGK